MSYDLMVYITMYIVIFLFGVVIGSFLNVCIYRIPKGESIVVVRSHCMNCNYELRWYDLVPLLSFLLLKGKCRKCNTKLSLQYPIIEAANGLAYCLVFAVRGFSLNSVCYCLLFSALIVISVIDWRTYEIPIGCNIFILAVGLIHLFLDYTNWLQYVIGLLAVSSFLMIVYLATKGRGIGGGDVKLMACCGLLLGWKLILVAFFFGCVLGAVLHLIRMKVSGADRQLAFGPYLSLGVAIATLWGEQILTWYLNFC